MKKWLLRLLYVSLIMAPIGAIADYTGTQGAGSTIFAFVCSATKICPAHVLINSSNVEVATAGNPLRTDPTGSTTQPVSAASLPLPTGAMPSSGGSITANAGTNLNTSALALETGGNLAQLVTDFGPPGATACATDTASCNQNQQLQRLAQRLTSTIAALGSPFQAGGALAPNQTVALAASSGADGWNITQGAKADAVCGTSTGTCSEIALLKFLNTQAATLVTNTAAAIPAGTANIGNVGQISQYPNGAVPITASATGTTAATTATLAASASIKTYICGLSIRANATAAATANSTVTGTITGTLNFTQWTAPNASGIGLTEQVFMPCVPSSAINTAIAVISAAPGAGGVVSVSAWGYQL